MDYGVIQYPFCYRGPFEYDKFVLNTLQYANMVNFVESRALKEEAAAVGKLLELSERMETLRQAVVNDPVTDKINRLRLIYE